MDRTAERSDPMSWRNSPTQDFSAKADSPQPQDGFRVEPPRLDLPKGGGAIRGIGEKFAANPVTGTGSMAVPIALSPGRSGFGPKLSLAYDSGAGNGPFGFGWQLSLPAITRKTEKGLPRYVDAADSDVFILSGAEDLVPLLVERGGGDWQAAKPQMRVVDDKTYLVRRYRPRTEGLFARIERWTNRADAFDMFWRTISRDNVTTWYGRSAESRIADPADPARIFSWLICESHDDRGNVVVYGYRAEDSARIFEDDRGQRIAGIDERNRSDRSRSAQRYLKTVRYANCLPYFPELRRDAAWPAPAGDWLFEAVLDYGDHDEDRPAPAPSRPWPARADRFSTCRPGFEVRTYRVCHRVLMFHHFPDEPGVGRDCLVRSTDFAFATGAPDGAAYTFLHAVTQTSYRRRGEGYDRRSLPPAEFGYSEATVQDASEVLEPESQEVLPASYGGAVRWADLHGEGLTGILSEQAGTWFYNRNVGPLGQRARFASAEIVALKPNVMLGAGSELMDLAGDGQPDVVTLDGPAPGFYEHDLAEGWQPFRPFASCPGREFGDPDMRFIDLDGNGLADLLITQDDAFVWHASVGEAGFAEAGRVVQALDEEKGPRLLFSDASQSIFLADMSGDGLTDLVRIRNEEVCYWPNQGYCRFGTKVAMAFAEVGTSFDTCDQFDPGRLRLADIDGSGTADIIYLHPQGVRLYFNRSGNSWSLPKQLQVLARGDDLTSIMAVDLLGNGTACLVWWSPLAGDSGRQLRYVDLMGGNKPHLLVRTANNLGVETLISYAPSTRFYLQDRTDGKPWATRLPFPVHVVDRVEIRDLICRNRFATRFAYHHGYFDGHEREFRGFGMVEQWDSEYFEALAGDTAHPSQTETVPQIPPIYTRTWFHTGAHFDRTLISRHYEREYFRTPCAQTVGLEAVLADTVLPAGLTADDEREACRALKGAILRSEVYALDGVGVTARTPFGIPYSVVEQNFAIRCLQPRRHGRFGVFFTYPGEAITCFYERNANDPRVQHALTLEVDDYGNVLKQVAIAYGRRSSLLPECWDRARQTTTLLTYNETAMTRDHDTGAAAIDLDDCYRLPVQWQSQAFELTGFAPGGPHGRYEVSDFVAPDPAAPDRLQHSFVNEVPFEGEPAGPQCRRTIGSQRTLFRRDDLGGLLPPGAMQPRAIAARGYKLALTPGLIDQVFRRPRPDEADETLLPAELRPGVLGEAGGYIELDGDGNWWATSGQAYFSPGPNDSAADELAEARRHFYLTRRYSDPFGQPAFVDFDAYDLLGAETRDALGNRVTIEANDYRVLQPRMISDPNRNRSEVAFDLLGLVAGAAVMGKPAPAIPEGDTLEGFQPDLTQDQLDALFAGTDPLAAAPELLAGASSRVVYDIDRFQRTRSAHPDKPELWQPAGAATLARETHVHAPLPRHGLRIQLGFSYSDGFGREIQKKAQAEPGPRPLRDADGRIRLDEGGQPLMEAGSGARWIGSGWIVFNNKAKPVRQFEPFFTDHYRFEFDPRIGVSPVLFYDPAGRVIATLHPQGTFEKVVFDAWSQTTYDVNDTCAPRGAETGDPRTDRDIAGFVAGYFASLPEAWKTWYAQRIDGALGPYESAAAERGAAHADTPQTMHLDVLGRPFLTIVRNRVACDGHELDGSEMRFANRVELDIQGRQRTVRDPVHEGGDSLGRIVGRFAFDVLGNSIRDETIDAGARWSLTDTLAKPIRAWDSRGHTYRSTYDVLRRPLTNMARGSGVQSDPQTREREIVLERIEYGESLPDPEALNMRTKVYRHFDGAGAAINARLDASGEPIDAFDFKGNLRHSTRRLARDYKGLPDWRQDVELEDEYFFASTRFDALNRPILTIPPRSSLGRGKVSVLQPTYSEASLLERLDVWLERDAEPDTPLDPAFDPPDAVGIDAITYNAKGQRLCIDLKNGAHTVYSYDQLNFRLMRLVTQHGDDAVQDLAYTYDAAGNATHIADAAHQTVFFRNKQVAAENDYTYDAIYRLIEGTGRELLGRCGTAIPYGPDDGLRSGLHPGDGNALARYVEQYVYDPAGNLLQMRHRGADAAHPGWTRRFHYHETSLIEPGKSGNRLSSTQTGVAPGAAREEYRHDAHGNMVAMPHLGVGAGEANMHWDYADNLRRIDKGGGGRAYYVYDSSGQRVRKVWEKSPCCIEERIYLGGFEVFRHHNSAIGERDPVLERETLHVLDDVQRIALVETRTLDQDEDDPALRQAIRYQFGNHLGSSSVELDENAQVVSHEEYSPFGSTTYQAVRNCTETPKRYRFTCKERDDESGLYYHGARYYAPWLGRWTAYDPAGFADGLNGYVYVRNNPVQFTDSTGAKCDPTRQSCIDPTASADDASSGSGSQSSGQGAAMSAAGNSAIRNNPVGPTLEVADNFDNEKIAAYKARITDPNDRAVGIRSKPSGSSSATADLRAANQGSRNAFNDSLPVSQRALKGVRDIDHTVEQQNIIRRGAPGADTVRLEDHRVQPSRLNSSQGSSNQKVVARQLSAGFPLDTPAGGVARESAAGSFWNSQQFRSFMRIGGYTVAVGGAFFSGYAFYNDIAEGNALSATLSGTGLTGGLLSLGGAAASSPLLLKAGAIIGAPAAVAGAGAGGWMLGTYTYENTAISDVADFGGSAVEGLTGSRRWGAVGAAATAVVTAPVFVPIAAAKATGRAESSAYNWTTDKIGYEFCMPFINCSD